MTSYLPSVHVPEIGTRGLKASVPGNMNVYLSISFEALNKVFQMDKAFDTSSNSILQECISSAVVDDKKLRNLITFYANLQNITEIITKNGTAKFTTSNPVKRTDMRFVVIEESGSNYFGGDQLGVKLLYKDQPITSMKGAVLKQMQGGGTRVRRPSRNQRRKNKSYKKNSV